MQIIESKILTKRCNINLKTQETSQRQSIRIIVSSLPFQILKKLVFIFLKINAKKVQNAQKENKSEQALQIISHVVADSMQIAFNAWA
jgi:hypothetical protein